jgi:hypothetical protein
MGFFNAANNRPRISKYELPKFYTRLRQAGLSENDLNLIKAMLSGTLGSQEGHTLDEHEAMIKWLNENRSKHTLSREQIETLDSIGREFIK